MKKRLMVVTIMAMMAMATASTVMACPNDVVDYDGWEDVSDYYDDYSEDVVDYDDWEDVSDYSEDVVDYDNWEDIVDYDENDFEDWQDCDLATDDTENYEEYGDITVGRHDYCSTVYMTAIVNVTVRTGPGTQYTPVDCISAGQKVGIVAEGPGHDGGRSWLVTEDGYYVIASAFTTGDYDPEEEEEAARRAAADTYVVEYYDTVCVDSNVRSGPGKCYEIVGGVSAGTSVGICYEESGWYYTDQGGWIAAYLFDEESCKSTTSKTQKSSCESKESSSCGGYKNAVVVDIEDQMVYVYENGECVHSASCVTGKAGVSDTPKGEFEIQAKETQTVLQGKNYNCPVDYWMPFNGGYGLHDASWRECFGGETYLHDGSHGCVNLDDDTAEFIYNNCSIGTKVIVK